MNLPITLSGRLSQIESKVLFFVAGSAKSGTTWLQLLLNAHRDISCNGEGHFGNQLGPALKAALEHYNQFIISKNADLLGEQGGFPCFEEDDLSHLLRTAVLLLLNRQVGHRNVVALGEKTPDNAHCLPLLHQMFPQARFIHLVRDGRDCAVSAWFHNQRLKSAWQARHFPRLEDYIPHAARTWRDDQRAMAAFSQQHPQLCLALRYEDLETDTSEILARLLTFLGLPLDPTLIEGCCATANFEALTGRPRGDEDRTSFFRKGVSGDWRNHFSAAANEAFLNEAGPVLAQFGYSAAPGEAAA